MKGPEKELLQLAVFGELLALFPGVHIHIELVGPAIPPHRSDALLTSHCSVIWCMSLCLNIWPFFIPVNRDGEQISIPKYPCCNEAKCVCRLETENKTLATQTGSTSALTLRLWRGFYHDRYRDIVKVSHCNIYKESICKCKSWLVLVLSMLLSFNFILLVLFLNLILILIFDCLILWNRQFILTNFPLSGFLSSPNNCSKWWHCCLFQLVTKYCMSRTFWISSVLWINFSFMLSSV